MKRFILTASLVASLALLLGCSIAPPQQTPTGVTVSPASAPPDTIVTTLPLVEEPDDIIPTPGGPSYRANVHQQGVPDLWPPIILNDAILADNITVTYRSSITTASGQTRNNLVEVRQTGVMQYPALILSISNIPAGFKVTQGEGGGGLPGATDQVLIIDISQGVKPGEYTFYIDVNFAGQDYGNVPCTVNVVQS